MLKRKIIITVPTLQHGGMERAVVNMAAELCKKNDVVIYTLSSNKVFYDIPKNVKIVFGKKDEKKRLLFFFSLWKLFLLCRKEKPDYLFSFSGRHSCFVILATLSVKTKVYVFHRSNPYISYGFLIDNLNKILFRKAAGLVVQTSEARTVFRSKYQNGNVIVFPNPIKKMNIDEKQQKENTILTVCRLVPGKGVDRLIKIFSKIDSKNWNLLIVGGGEEYDKLSTLVKELNLQAKIHFTGFVKNVDVYLERAAIFAFTSYSEGFPNALLEAMCAGMACISFDCPTGPKDMIVDGVNGFLIPMDNEDLYVKRLKEMMNNKNLRKNFGFEARKLNEIHAPQRVIEKLLDDINI